jgi:hypothetical protein
MRIKNGMLIVEIKNEHVMGLLTAKVKAEEAVNRKDKAKVSADKTFALAVLENARQSIDASKWAAKQTPNVFHQSIVEGIRQASPISHTHLFIDTGRVWIRGGRKKKRSLKVMKPPDAPFPSITPVSLEAEYCDFLERGRHSQTIETAELFNEEVSMVGD